MEDKKHDELLFYIVFKNITNEAFDSAQFLLAGSKAKDCDINILSSVKCHTDVLLTVTFKPGEKAVKTLCHIRDKGYTLKERVEIEWFDELLLLDNYLSFLYSAPIATEKDVHQTDKAKQYRTASSEHPFPKTKSKCDASMSKNDLRCPGPSIDSDGIPGIPRAEDHTFEPCLIYIAFENTSKGPLDCKQILLTQNEVKGAQIHIWSTVLCGVDVLLTVTFSSMMKALDVLRCIRTKEREEIKWYYNESLPSKYSNCFQSVPQNRDGTVYQNDKKTKQIQRTDVNLPKQPRTDTKTSQHYSFGNKGGETSQQSTKSTTGSDEKNTKVDSVRPKEEGTCVYVSIQESVKERLLEGFLQARIGATEFKVISIEKDQKTSLTMVIIQFRNKHLARDALNLLRMSNLNSETQLGCSLTSPNDTVEFRKEQLANKLKDIQNRSSKVLHELRSKTDRANQEQVYIRCVQDIKDRLSNLITSENFEYILEYETNNFNIECCRLESGLPIYGRRLDVLKLIQENQVVIIRGETGSGKSTQLVQYLYQADFGKTGMITCTQPRKVACVSLAERVATELVTNVGQIVGYKSGLRKNTSEQTKIIYQIRREISKRTKIVYQTHHSLLQECLKDPRLTKYSCIIIDEAHERSIYTDILISIIKMCLPVRPDLKIIITSATIEVDIFSRYFSKCPTIEISGRAFPVNVIWRDEKQQNIDFENIGVAAVDVAENIHNTEGPGDILVFLTSPMDTETCKDDLENRLIERTDCKCFSFHGQLQPSEQQEVFRCLPIGQRKIVFATNAAETSITIPGIRFVIDTGMAKEREFDPFKHINTLRLKVISRSSANQRKGRAGRTAPGTCYRLYTRQSYEEMNPTSVPEIQRVHLGQTLLMLYEMGIDPLVCEFVEAPSPEAMGAARKTLEELRCVVGGRITELGKWLAKIPMEPRLAIIIRLGYDNGILFDAIVFAVLFGSCENSIFYRSGSDEDKTNADQLKLRFCHDKGDGLTFMEIYKEWVKQPERRQGPWCFENKINAKVLRGARETILEIIAVLRKEYNITVDENLKSGTQTVELLQKFVLYAFFNNICCHIGHDKLGYFVPDLDQMVSLHPSSALKALNDSSEWLVFGNFLRTSRDFITTVTPIREEWIIEIANKKKQHFDFEKVRRMKLSKTHTELFGKTTMTNFIGAKYTNIKRCEVVLSDEFQTPIVLDVDRDLGEIHLFAPSKALQSVERFKSMVKCVKDPVRKGFREFRLGSARSGGVRIVIGSGGEGQMILLPNEYRSVYVVKHNGDTNTEEIIRKFSNFGEIVDSREYAGAGSGGRWGELTFKSPASALEAVRVTRNMESDVATPVITNVNDSHAYQFKVKLMWCRRPLTGLGFVDIDPSELYKAIEFGELLVLGSAVTMDLDRKTQKSLCLRRLPETVTEDDIHTSLCRVLGLHTEDEKARINSIRLIREKVRTTDNEGFYIKELIERAIGDLIPPDSFVVDLMTPTKDTNINYHAWVRFNHIQHGEIVIDNGLVIMGNTVRITPHVSTFINVTQNVYEKMCPAVEENIQILKSHGYCFDLQFRWTNKNRVSIQIFSTKPRDLAHVRSILAGLLKGDNLECWRDDRYRFLFLQEGRKFLRDLGKKTNTHIVVDDRRINVNLYGTREDTSTALHEIETFLTEIIKGTGREIPLGSADQPKGLIKTLIKTYGLNLEKLTEEEGLCSVLLNYPTKVLKLIGPKHNVDAAIRKIFSIASEITKTNTEMKPNNEHPECSICYTAVEEISKLYRLEYCGHPYCLDCLCQQTEHAIQNKDLPITCEGDGCREPFVWQDFLYCFKKFNIEDERLVNAAVDKFVMKNRESYRRCLSADCSMVYRVTLNGSLFVCGECRLKICTTCHVEYHDGLTCEMFNNVPEEEENECLVNAAADGFVMKNRESHRNCLTAECSMVYPVTLTGAPFVCSECRLKICTTCHVEYHDGLTCEMFKSTSKAEDSFAEFLRENKDTFKKCPKCETVYEKMYGCHHMYCNSCGNHFCWVCLASFGTSLECYTHLDRDHGGILNYE
ncbi:hypothetical protein SNE40_004163 [Patella caerulea]|uniref:RNA helicase n=1 Tax=Patella caerulea TaxID=87958 RepID=A0AAN8QGC9_PATCE